MFPICHWDGESFYQIAEMVSASPPWVETPLLFSLSSPRTFHSDQGGDTMWGQVMAHAMPANMVPTHNPAQEPR